MAEEAVIVTVPPDPGPVDGPVGHGQSLQDRRKSLELNRIEAEKELELIRQKYKDKKGMDFSDSPSSRNFAPIRSRVHGQRCSELEINLSPPVN